MNSIVDIHCLTINALDRADIALARLGRFLDEDGPTIEQIARIVGRPDLSRPLQALQALHCGEAGTDEITVLVAARRYLEELLIAFQSLPVSIPSPQAVKPEDLILSTQIDQAVRWCGARIEDAHAAINHLIE